MPAGETLTKFLVCRGMLRNNKSRAHTGSWPWSEFPFILCSTCVFGAHFCSKISFSLSSMTYDPWTKQDCRSRVLISLSLHGTSSVRLPKFDIRKIGFIPWRMRVVMLSWFFPYSASWYVWYPLENHSSEPSQWLPLENWCIYKYEFESLELSRLRNSFNVSQGHRWFLYLSIGGTLLTRIHVRLSWCLRRCSVSYVHIS